MTEQPQHIDVAEIPAAVIHSPDETSTGRSLYLSPPTGWWEHIEYVRDRDLRSAPGALDGAVGHLVAPADRAVEVGNALVSVCREPSMDNLRDLYAAVMADDVRGYVDALIERLRDDGVDRPALHTIGRCLP